MKRDGNGIWMRCSILVGSREKREWNELVYPVGGELIFKGGETFLKKVKKVVDKLCLVWYIN